MNNHVTPENFRNYELMFNDAAFHIYGQVETFNEFDISDTPLAKYLADDLAFNDRIDALNEVATSKPTFGPDGFPSDKAWDAWARANAQKEYAQGSYRFFVRDDLPKALRESEAEMMKRLRAIFNADVETLTSLAEQTTEADTVSSLVDKQRLETASLLAKAKNEIVPRIRKVGAFRNLLGGWDGVNIPGSAYAFSPDADNGLTEDSSAEEWINALRAGVETWLPTYAEAKDHHSKTVAAQKEEAHKNAAPSFPAPRHTAIVMKGDRTIGFL